MVYTLIECENYIHKIGWVKELFIFHKNLSPGELAEKTATNKQRRNCRCIGTTSSFPVLPCLINNKLIIDNYYKRNEYDY